MIVAFNTSSNTEVFLSPIKKNDESDKSIYELIDENKESWMTLVMINNQFVVQERNSRITDSKEVISQKLDELVLAVIEQEQSGTEITDFSDNIINPYDPDSIKVQTKTFNVKLISDMIDSGDIDLSPDFQRNFVWNSIQKSRLIESILLRIPLPMFYFSEDKDGLITVVDGLQRLTTIKEFMDNKFPLKGLEYLKDSCEDRYYSEKNKDGSPNGLKSIETKYFRWFNMTQFTVNVIDPTSPPKVKYDIFRRINTGGKSLNNQEIRNCLASKNLREVLQEMTSLDIFKKATDNSIKGLRMEDKEVALRFICFHRYYQEDKRLNSYNGNMEMSLDEVTELLNSLMRSELKNYVELFSRAMCNAEHLFGKYAFRKIKPVHLEPGQNKQLINKALFVSLSVLLSRYDLQKVKSNHVHKELALPLANLIDYENNSDLYYYLSYGTNGKANLQYVFRKMNEFLEKHLKV